MNYWKLMLAIVTGILIAFAVIMGACTLNFNREMKGSRLEMLERVRQDYFERTGNHLPPAEELEREFQEYKSKQGR